MTDFEEGGVREISPYLRIFLLYKIIHLLKKKILQEMIYHVHLTYAIGFSNIRTMIQSHTTM